MDAEEATAVVRPGAKAKLITGRRFAELLAPGQFGSEGASIISRGHRGHRRRHVLFAGHLDRRRGERNGDEDDGSQPGECLSVHGSPQFPFGNMRRSEEHTSELQSLMRISYAVFCLKKKKNTYV